MRIVIVYESLFGNTRTIAESIADGVRVAAPTADVRCVRVGDAATDIAASADLLIVGGPTHMRGMTSGISRRKGLEAEAKSAADFHPEPEPATQPGLRDWLADLPRGGRGSRAAAFDTRVAARMAGGAARGIGHRLHRHGYRLLTGPKGFIVQGTEGPLSSDEKARAAVWGAGLMRQLAPAP
jgi:hypothetical protein